jgi:hypothetical protein
MAKALIDLVDPDLVYGTPTSSGQSAYSVMSQLHNKVLSGNAKYMTMEWNRCMLDGTWEGLPDNPVDLAGKIGYIGNSLTADDCTFSAGAWVQLNITNCSILQAAAVSFTGIAEDGYGVDFTFEVYSGATAYYSKSVTGNTEQTVYFEGFTVYDVTALRVTFAKWSLPRRFPRSVEIIPGIYENWLNDIIYNIDIMQQADFSCMSLPYGTAILEIWNKNKRFDRRNKSGLFKSIEERQPIPLFMGPKLADGTSEYLPVGVYYQQNGGWEKGNRGLTMKFRLVDIIGLLSGRKFKPPAVLPTTVEGWIAEIVSQLGTNFVGHYLVDSSIASISLTCAADNVSNIVCDQLLRFVCMAVGAYPCADSSTGYLKAGLVPAAGGTIITLDNMSDYPKESANDDVATVTFEINDGSNTQYTIGGTSTAANKTLSISNFFIKTTAQADVAARNILKFFGGQKYEANGRGDLRSEIGDIDVIELGLEDSAGGRRYKQQFRLNSKGVMKDVISGLVQATGETLYSNVVVITESGPVQMPSGATEIKIILGEGGHGGYPGTGGTFFTNGEPGPGGRSGRIFTATVNINSGATLTVVIGTGGTEGQPGTHTTLNSWTSADGEIYDGWVDIVTGNVYGRFGAPGVAPASSVVNGTPGAANTGNGGGGGSGGHKAIYTTDRNGIITSVIPEVPGGAGAVGGSGFAIISYDI